MKNSPRTTICGILIFLTILLVFVKWHVFGAAGATHVEELEEVGKILIAIFALLLGFFAADEVTH